MEEILIADSLRCYQQKNWKTPFILCGKAGERIFVHGTRDQCRFLFEMLSGLRTPDAGQVRVLGQDLYELPEHELAVFRREKIGAIPQGGGFLSEFSLLEQLLWPLRLSGKEIEVLRSRIQTLDLRYFPTHNLYNPAKRCTVRTRSLAVLVRATLFQPKLIILNGTFEDLDAKDTEIIWEQVPKICGPDTCFLYLSSTPIPQRFSWTRQLRI